MPNLNEMVDNVALAISGNTEDPVWFSIIDLKYVYSQMKLSEATSRQCNFNIVGGTITGTYRFKSGFYGLGDKPNEYQQKNGFLAGTLTGGARVLR